MSVYDPSYNWRRLPLTGASNVRDIGGYPTCDGAMTAYHCFLRSNTLAYLSEEDENFLYDYGVRTVIDLRAEREIQRESDKFIQREDVDYLQVGLLSGNMADPHYMSTFEHRITPHEVYHYVVDNKEAMAQVMRALVHAAPGCVLFHCAVGKDRTGIVAMLLMRLAGCDIQDCLDNYVVSEIHLRRDESFVDIYERSTQEERPFLESPVEFLQDIMDYLQDTYASVDNYLLDIGLSADEVEGLKDRVLGKGPTLRKEYR